MVIFEFVVACLLLITPSESAVHEMIQQAADWPMLFWIPDPPPIPVALPIVEEPNVPESPIYQPPESPITQPQGTPTTSLLTPLTAMITSVCAKLS